MKSLLTYAFCMVLCLSAIAQDEQDKPGKGSYLPIDSATQLVTYGGEVQINNTPENLFNRALEWLDTAFRYSSGPEVRLADLSTGKIICKQSILEPLTQYTYATLTYTLLVKIENGGFKYKFTNLYIDRIASGGFPNVPVEMIMHATRKQYDTMLGGLSIGGYQSELDKFLAPIDGVMQSQVASFRHSMTRDVSGDKNTW